MIRGGSLSVADRMRTVMSGLLARAVPKSVAARVRSRRSGTAVSLFVPLEGEDSRAFALRGASILADARAHIFIDTSFLM